MTTKLARMAEVLSRSPSTRNIGTTTELSQNVAAGVTKTAVPGGEIRCRAKSGKTKNKAKAEQRKQEDEGCKGASSCHIRGADAGKPNPSQYDQKSQI